MLSQKNGPLHTEHHTPAGSPSFSSTNMSEVKENGDPAPTKKEEEPKPSGATKEERAEEWKDLMGLDLQMKVSCSQAKLQ